MSQRDAEMVAALAALEDDDDDDDAPVIAVPPARGPAQVYSIRIPVERIEQLRVIAARQDVTPSALMRSWVIERLEQLTPTNVVTIHRSPSSQPDMEHAQKVIRSVG